MDDFAAVEHWLLFPFPVGSSTVTEAEMTSAPVTSVTVTLYVPPGTPARFAVVAPLLQAYVKGAPPPVTVAVTLPSAYEPVPEHVEGSAASVTASSSHF